MGKFFVDQRGIKINENLFFFKLFLEIPGKIRKFLTAQIVKRLYR